MVAELTGQRTRVSGRNCVLVVGHLAGPFLFGAERSLLDVLDGFAAIGIDVVVAVPPDAADNADYLQALLERSVAVHLEAIPVHRSPSGPDEAVIDRFCRIIGVHGVSAVHCNTVVPLEPLIAARRCGVKAVVNAREIPHGNPDLCEWMGATADEIVSSVLSEADYIIANSKMTALSFPLSGRVSIVPNVVDVARFQIDRAPSDSVRVGLVGHVSHSKGLKEFLELAERLDGLVDATFVLVGAFTEEATRWIEAEGVSGNTVIAGYASTPEEAIQQVDILVSLSTVTESFSRSVLEAMAGGLPVVAFNEGGQAELIRDGETGFLVEPGNLEEFADRVHRLCLDADLRQRMGRAGRRVVEQHYNPGVLADCLGLAYRAVLPPPAAVAQAADDLSLVLPYENRTHFVTPFFVGSRARFATCTDVAFIDHERLVTASLLGRRMYLVRFDPRRRIMEIVSETPTIGARGEASIDLLDVDSAGRIVTADCEQSSVSLYRAGSRAIQQFDTIPLRGYCHGAAFVPGSPDLVCASITDGDGDLDVGVHFVSISRRRIVGTLTDRGWIPKSVAFSGPRSMIVASVRQNVGQVPHTVHHAKLSLIKLSRRFRRGRHVAEYRLPGSTVDGCRVHGSRLFVANQVDDVVMEFEIAERSFRRLPDRQGFPFPHGVAVSHDGRWMATANYGTNALTIRALRDER